MKNLNVFQFQYSRIKTLMLACFGLVVALCGSAAFAQNSVERPDTPIGVISYAGGEFKQDLSAYGQWTEYDHRGAVRYKFEEQSFDGDTLRLRGRGGDQVSGQDGDVDLVVDLLAKTVAGEWPGHPMRTIYRITDIDYLSFALPVGESLPSPAPPPLPDEPKTVSPLVTGASITKAIYNGGYFTQTSPVQWQEKTSSGQFINFRKIGFDDRSVYLYDSSRNYLIQIDTVDSMIRLSDNGAALNPLYAITDFDIESPIIAPTLPPTLPEPGRLSAREQVECISSGGFIERAGMLGYERCTLRYSDAGRVCSDSSFCQGKCLTGLDDAQSKNVSGTCQATDNPFGCYAEVLDGATAPALCVD